MNVDMTMRQHHRHHHQEQEQGGAHRQDSSIPLHHSSNATTATTTTPTYHYSCSRSMKHRVVRPVLNGLTHIQSHWRVLALGQALSFLLAGSGASSASLHLQCNLSAPAFQSLFLYGILCCLNFAAFVVRQCNGVPAAAGTAAWSGQYDDLADKGHDRDNCVHEEEGGGGGGSDGEQENNHLGGSDYSNSIKAWRQFFTNANNPLLNWGNGNSTTNRKKNHRRHPLRRQRRRIKVSGLDERVISTPSTSFTNNNGLAEERTTDVQDVDQYHTPAATITTAALAIRQNEKGMNVTDKSNGDKNKNNNDNNEKDDNDDDDDEEDDSEQTTTRHHNLCFFIPQVQTRGHPALYLVLSVLDVEANYLTFSSFRYTTFTSISIFDSLSIPSALILSGCLLGRTYRPAHLAGASVCMVGVLANVWSDYESPDPDEYPHKVFGDWLAIAGGILYGVNAVLAEMAVKGHGAGQEEYLAMLGLFGTVVSVVQVVILERHDVMEFFHRGHLNRDILSDDEVEHMDSDDERPTCSRTAGVGLLFLYVLSSYVSYVGVARFLSQSESALLKLSLLTSDLWAVLFSVFAEHIVPPPLFWAALAMIVSGVFIYETAPSPIDLEDDNNRKEERIDGKVVLDEEYVTWMNNYVSWANELELELTEEAVRGATV